MRNWIKTLFFLSSFSPTLLVLAGVKYESQGLETSVWQLLIIGVLGVIIPLLIIKMISTSSEKIYFEAKKVESNDFMLFMFISSYFMPLIVKSLDASLMTGLIVFAALAFVLWMISYIPCHPLLHLFKFRFYKAESSGGVVFTLIARREIRDPRTIKAVKQLSSTMLMETE